MSFKARFRNPKQFSNVIAVLNEFVDVASFDVSKQGIALTTMDTSHVFVVELFFEDKAFLEFACERRTSVGVKLDVLSKVLKSVKKGDMLMFGSDDEDSIYVSLYKNDGVSKKTRFELSQMMVINQDQLQLPDRSYACEVMMSTELFQEVCTELKAMGEQVRISISKDEICFAAPEGNLKGEIRLSPSGANEALALICTENRAQSFKNKFLQKMGKAAKMTDSKEIIIQMDNDAPLSFGFAFDEPNSGGLNFFLAPLIDD
jgi:proliferating cell nuclear antigen